MDREGTALLLATGVVVLSIVTALALWIWKPRTSAGGWITRFVK